MTEEHSVREQHGTSWGRVRFGARRTPAPAIALPAGAVLAAGIAALAAIGFPDAFGLANGMPLVGAVVFAVLLAAPCAALVWVLVVDRTTLRGAVADPEHSIESGWYRDAASGAYTDTLTAAGLALTVVSVGRIAVDGQLVLVAVVLLGMASFGVRYLVARRRG